MGKPLDVIGIPLGGRGKLDIRVKPKPKFNWEQMDALRASSGLVGVQEVPEGAVSLLDYSEQYDLAIPTARNQVRRMVKERKLQTGKKLVVTGDGRRRLVNYYWPIPRDGK